MITEQRSKEGIIVKQETPDVIGEKAKSTQLTKYQKNQVNGKN